MNGAIRSPAVAVLALLAALALALSACGGGDSSTTTSAQPGAPDADAMAAFQSCMEENGASLPDMASGETAGQPPALDEDTQAAMEACQDLMPAPPDGAPAGAPPTGTS